MQILIALLGFLFVYGSFGIVQFYQCPNEIVPDKDKGGFMTIQFCLCFVFTGLFFVQLSELFDLEERFGENNWQRIVFVICLAFIVFVVLGLLIEGFLFLTSKTYRKWRTGKEE